MTCDMSISLKVVSRAAVRLASTSRSAIRRRSIVIGTTSSSRAVGTLSAGADVTGTRAARDPAASD